MQKRTQIQWDIGAALGTGNGADESTSPQAGISHLGPIYVGTIIYVVGALVALIGLSQTALATASAGR